MLVANVGRERELVLGDGRDSDVWINDEVSAEEGERGGGFVERGFWEGVGAVAWEDGEVYSRVNLKEYICISGKFLRVLR